MSTKKSVDTLAQEAARSDNSKAKKKGEWETSAQAMQRLKTEGRPRKYIQAYLIEMRRLRLSG